MNQFLKKFTGGMLLTGGMLVAILSVLSIWGVNIADDVLWRSFKSMVVLFLAAVFCLFIFAIFFKNEDGPKQSGSQNTGS